MATVLCFPIDESQWPMSYSPDKRAKADGYDPAMCRAAMELLPRMGLIDGYLSPAFIRPAEYEDKALGIDMHMLVGEHSYKLAFRMKSTIRFTKDKHPIPLIHIRDTELEKMRDGKYQADFFIIAENDFNTIVIIDVEPWLQQNEYAIQFNKLGEKKDDPRNNGKHYLSVEAKSGGRQVIFYPMNISGTKRVPYKARGEIPLIFLTKEDYEEACVLHVCDDFKIEEYTWRPQNALKSI